MSIAENLLKWRERRGMTQQELADAVGVSRPMIAQMERGTKCVSLQLAAQIAKVLECSIEDFLPRAAG